jgi:dihydrofolate reductase
MRIPRADFGTAAGRCSTSTAWPERPRPRAWRQRTLTCLGERPTRSWPPTGRSNQGRPFAKYVASRTLQSVEWENSTLIKGDVAGEVAKLKEQPGKNIAVLGSGELVQTLIENDLVDEYLLTVSPIVLGSGKRLFREADQSRSLSLVDSKTTSTGNLMLTYRPA